MTERSSDLSQSPLFLGVLLFGLFLILILGAAARHMRPDEGIALFGTSGTLASTIDFQARDVHAPLYFVAFYFWQQVIGDGEITGRVFSVLTALLALALTYWIGRRWFVDSWTGIAALIATGLSSYFFLYAVEIRPYAMLMLVAALSMACFASWLARPTWPRALGYGLTIALILYLHYLGLFLILGQGLYFLAFRLRQIRKLWLQGLGAVGLALLLWLPWLPTFIAQVRHVGALVKEGETRIPGLGMASTTLPTTGPTIVRFLNLATNSLPLLFGALIVIGVALLWRKQLYWLALCWGIGVPALMFLVNLVVPVYEPRYAATLIPGLGLVVGAALAALPRPWSRVAIGVFALVGLFTVRFGVPDNPPVRDYLREFQAAFRPGDAVLLDEIALDYIADYQYSHYAPSAYAYLRSPDADALAAKIEQRAETLPRCIWHVTRDWFNDEVRARFEFIAASHPLQQVIGDQRYLFQRLCSPPLAEPIRFGDVFRFRGADIEGMRDSQITLKLWWEVTQQPALDYSFGVHLLDTSGTLVAQQDGPINDFYGRGTFQTSALEPGFYYIDLRTLELPAHLPPGEYTLMLTAYDPYQLVRLPVAGTEDNLLKLETLKLP